MAKKMEEMMDGLDLPPDQDSITAGLLELGLAASCYMPLENRYAVTIVSVASCHGKVL